MKKVKTSKKVGGITLFLMMMAASMAALSMGKTDEVEKIVSVNSIMVAPNGIAAGTANSYTTPETSHTDAEAPLSSDPVPMVPPENSVAESASGEASEGAGTEVQQAEGEVVTEERTWYGKLWDYLAADEDSVKAAAIYKVEGMKLDRKYGEGSSQDPNRATLEEAEQAMRAADERREQKELALRVKASEQQRLYDESLLCLALNGYHEARGETADQEVATAAVVLNRLSVNFRGATNVCEVIYTPKQFSWVEEHGVHIPDLSNKLEKQAWERSMLIARRMLDPDATFIDPSNGALYYYNPSIVDWKYKHAYVQVAVLGNHRFMTEKELNHPHHIDNRQVRINPVLFNGLTSEERQSLISEYQKAGD